MGIVNFFIIFEIIDVSIAIYKWDCLMLFKLHVYLITVISNN